MRLLSRALAVAGAAMALTAAPAAAQIEYSTMGTFGGGAGCSTNTCTVGGITITYNSASSVGSPVGAPSFISFGTFQTTGSSPSGAFSVPFTLTITQTAPTAGSGTFASGTVSGTLMVNSSQATFVVNNTGEVVTIGQANYSWLNTTYGLVPPSVDAGAGLGVTTLQGQVAVVPEPGTVLLLGTGLAGLGLVGFRRRRENV